MTPLSLLAGSTVGSLKLLNVVMYLSHILGVIVINLHTQLLSGASGQNVSLIIHLRPSSGECSAKTLARLTRDFADHFCYKNPIRMCWFVLSLNSMV